ncbi:MAG: PH domain-containing protein [Blastocatellia bacterium]|nr:PH domain-containing protein [Blastocatellia bacterium]
MFCIKCGTNNLVEAIYCQKCGNLLESEEETRVARREKNSPFSDDREQQIFSVSPTLLFVKLGYVLAIVGAFFVVAFFSILFPAVAWWFSVPLGILLLLIPAFYHFRQKLLRYTLTDTTIEIDKGIVSRTTQNVPLRRVQDVTVSSTIMQRMFNFGDVLIDNASEDGGKIVLKNIDSPRKYADILLKQMRRLEK